MNDTLDIAAATGGRFAPRITADGRPTSFHVVGDILTIRRERGNGQTIDGAAGLGAIALCSAEGRVLGYGTMDLADASGLADDVDAVLGATAGRPFERLAAHGLRLVLPIDGMPSEIRDMLLDEQVPRHFVETASISDDVIDELAGPDENAHHHAADEECTTCAEEDPLHAVRQQVEDMISAQGHALIEVETSRERPTFSYTVGLADAGWPELLLTGLGDGQGRQVLDLVITRLRRQEITPTEGMVVTGAINMPIRLRAVSLAAGHEWTRVAGDRHVRRGLDPSGHRVLQVLWPDVAGRFPDEEGYDGTDLPKQVLV